MTLVVHCRCGDSATIYAPSEDLATVTAGEFWKDHSGPECWPCNAKRARKARRRRQFTPLEVPDA